MAALSGGFIFNLTLCGTEPLLISPSASSSCSNKFFGDRIFIRHSFSNSDSHGFVSFTPAFTITARYGRSQSSQSSRSSRDDSNKGGPLNLSSIKSDSVRVIDAEQNMFGVVSKTEARLMAENAGLDLVIVAPDADPPVVKIMDYSKFKYEQQKKKKEQQKKSNRMDLKELKMGYNIDVHDYTVRLKAAKRFINDGDKVKVVVNLKGRENEFRSIAVELLRRFQTDVGEDAFEESKNLRERNIYLVLTPKKTTLQKAQEQPKPNEDPQKQVSAAAV